MSYGCLLIASAGYNSRGGGEREREREGGREREGEGGRGREGEGGHSPRWWHMIATYSIYAITSPVASFT